MVTPVLPSTESITCPPKNLPPTSYSFVLTFSEKTKGWVSFRSFHEMQLAISMGNDYYTFKGGNLWKHYDETVDRNTFYDVFTESSISVVLNNSPSLIKAFNTLNYEGSQSSISRYKSEEITLDYQPTTTYNDQETYNLSNKCGWYVGRIFTDKEEGYINEFIEKEGKWFNHINRLINTDLSKADTADFTFQGIGGVTSVSVKAGVGSGYDPVSGGSSGANGADGTNGTNGTNGTSTSDISTGVSGCTNPNATNYDPNATVDDGSCIIPLPQITGEESLVSRQAAERGATAGGESGY